jgi:ABC-type transport system substrate-binding protein
VGSGPFQFAGLKEIDGRRCALFVANPRYGWRTAHQGTPGRPFIREVRFFVSKDPVADFRKPTNPLHLLLDLPTEKVAPLQREGITVRTLENRRVYFLAINHKVEVLRDSPSLRRALAHGLDRQKILTACFRGGQGSGRGLGAVLGAAGSAAAKRLQQGRPEFHRPVNGPYPPRSWACAPATRVPADLYDPERARSLLKDAKEKEGVARVELTLKYPDDDPHVGQACQEMARQLTALGEAAGCPVQIKPVALAPHALRQALDRRDYQLAYHHLDYDSEAYWLWPLFDTRKAALDEGGSNYLLYHNDAGLESMFREAMSHRDFAQVREITQDIHAHLYDRMPIIPLWQLDTHLALHPDLQPTHVDSLLIFSDVADWRLKK